MFEIDFFAVCAATIVASAIGIIWYSPWLFGRLWIQYVNGEEAYLLGEGQWRRALLGALSQLCLFFVMAHMILTLSVASFRLFLLMLVVGVGALLVSPMIGERRSVTYALITIGYAVTVVIVGACVLAYWPW